MKLCGIVLLMMGAAVTCDESEIGGRGIGWRTEAGYDFPMPLGAVWTYEVYDSVAPGQGASRYHMTVTVEQVNRWGDDSTVATWSVRSGDEEYEATVRIVDDELTIWPMTALYPFGWEGLPLPIREQFVRQYGDPCGGALAITDGGDITVPAGRFPRTLAIVSEWGDGCADYGGAWTTWFAPGVGAVKVTNMRVTVAGLSRQELTLTRFVYPK